MWLTPGKVGEEAGVILAGILPFFLPEWYQVSLLKSKKKDFKNICVYTFHN